MFRLKIALIALLAFIGFAASPAVFAAGNQVAATPQAKHLVQVQGTISDFNVMSITVKTLGGDVKAVAVTDSTKFYLHGKLVNDPMLSKGERLAVLAHQELDGSLTALTVRLAGKGRNGLVLLGGRISDFNSTAVTVRTPGGDVKAAHLTQATKYYLDGRLVSQRPQMHVNERIRILARLEKDGSLTALRVHLIDRDDLTIAGVISNFNAGSLTVNSQGDVRAFKLLGTTKYYVDGKLVTQRPDFHRGERIRVFAEREQDGSYNALRVYVGLGADALQIVGKISDFNGISITILTTGNDVKAVRLTLSTKYYVNGKLVPVRPTFSTGEAIRVKAHVEGDGSLTALKVFVA